MKKARSLTKKSGFSLVEVLLSVTLFIFVVTSFLGILFYGEQSTAIAGNRARAVYLAEEGLEAVRNMRDENFNNLTDGTYGLTLASNGVSNQWNLTGSETIDIFTRQIDISTVDTDTKNIISTVTWQQTPQNLGTVSLSTKLKNWRTVFNQAANLIVITSSVLAEPDAP